VSIVVANALDLVEEQRLVEVENSFLELQADFLKGLTVVDVVPL
jgi:hypothetical protein